jgi:hypothetical protein
LSSFKKVKIKRCDVQPIVSVGFVGWPVIPFFGLKKKKECKEGDLGEEGFENIVDQNLCMLNRNSVIPWWG